MALCQKVGAVIDNVPREQCSKIYPLLAKKCKRSLRTGVHEMFKGSLFKHMTEEEKKVFKDNKEGVKALLCDHDCNPFDEKLDPVTRTVYGLIEEMEDKSSTPDDSEDIEWSKF